MEGCAEVAAPLTALVSPTARFAWTPAAQAGFAAQASVEGPLKLKRALSSAPVLRTLDPARRAALTTDASSDAPSRRCYRRASHDGPEQHRRRGDPDAAGRRGVLATTATSTPWRTSAS